jgi:hypothetical protein
MSDIQKYLKYKKKYLDLKYYIEQSGRGGFFTRLHNESGESYEPLTQDDIDEGYIIAFACDNPEMSEKTENNFYKKESDEYIVKPTFNVYIRKNGKKNNLQLINATFIRQINITIKTWGKKETTERGMVVKNNNVISK